MKSVAARVLVTALILEVLSVPNANGQQSDSRASNRSAKAESVYAEISKAPEKARVRRNPLEKDPQATAAGRILFEQHCAECHGDAAEGGKKGPNLKAPEIQNAEPGAVFWILTNGVVRKGMPVWSKLPEPQRWQLVTYIKSLGVAPAAPETPSVAAPKPPVP
jgi:mono/diheme cytochrome c family protein